MEIEIKELYDLVFLFVRKRINNLQDAQDLTQEIFYKFSTSKNEKIKSIKSWIYAIARNAIVDYYRKREECFEQLNLDGLWKRPNNDGIIDDLSECINWFIQLLPEEDRSFIELVEIDNIPQKEIAKLLKINYNTVRSKVQRGRKKIKSLFFNCCVIKQGNLGSILEYKKRNCRVKVEVCFFNKSV